MWLQNNFNLVMIAGLTLIIGLSVGDAKKTHNEINKGVEQWLLNYIII